MIKVCYDADGPELSMSGHAGQGARGSDVVCAAASVLLFTLLSELLRLGVEHERQMRPGFARIRGQGGRAVFDCVCTGLMLLAENYPDAVSFTEKSGEQCSPLRDTKISI